MQRRHLDSHASRRLAAAAATLAAVVVAASIGLSGSATAQRVRAAPSLTVTARNPVTVRGSHFAPRSRVNVTVVAARTLSRHARSDARGRFEVTFPTVIDRCTSWSVSASQRNHARVVLRGAKPECAPA